MKKQSTNSNISEITSELKIFCTRKEDHILVLKGQWGIGKTHFVNKFVNGHPKDVHKVKKGYGYVSLFGVNNLQELSERCADAFASELIKAGANGSSISKILSNSNITAIGKTAKAIAKTVPYIRNAGGVAAEYLMNNRIVCFDDLERCGASFRLLDFFGFVDNLKNRYDCRCILIFNENHLKTTAHSSDLDLFREKIIDLELEFNPDFDTTFNLAFSGSNRHLKEVLQRSGLKNIRIFRKIRFAVEQFYKHLKALDAPTRQAFEKQIAIISLIHHGFSSAGPIENLNGVGYVAVTMDGPGSPMRDIVQRLQFISTEFDEAVIAFLRKGYVNAAHAKNCIARSSNILAKVAAQSQLFDFGTKAFSNFKESQSDLIILAKSILKESIELLPIESLQSLITFIEKYGSAEDQSEIGGTWDEYDAKVISELDKDQIYEVIENRGSEIPTQLRDKFRKRYGALTSKLDILEVVKSLGHREFYSPRDFYLLNQYEQSAFNDLFSSKGENFIISFVARVISRLPNDKPKISGEIMSKITVATSKFSSRSKLDKDRMQKIIDALASKQGSLVFGEEKLSQEDLMFWDNK